MHWRETLIKSSDIAWKKLKPITTDDGKLDIILSLPLTTLFEQQAKRSFALGMNVVLQFLTQHHKENKPIEPEDIVKLLYDCGLPEKEKP